MKNRRSVLAAGAASLLVLALARGDAARAKKESDPLAADIERWKTLLATSPATDENWQQVKQVAAPVVARAEEALKSGRRDLALQRLAAVRHYLSASEYVQAIPEARLQDDTAFEAEWTKQGKELAADMVPIAPGAFDGVAPAAVRAVGELALFQVKPYYDSSLEYGRNTMAFQGFFYIGAARAERELAELSRKLAAPSAGRAPRLRALTPELDRLEGELLAAYRPPASIDKHSEFIAWSSAVNEARELDTAGLKYGALLRYLQAALRAAPLRTAAPADAAALRERLAGFDKRLAADGVDHSIGRMFLDSAQDDLAAAGTGEVPASVAVIANDILPRYFAALEPAPAEAPRADARVTVTLVRWPFT